jgi:hypothetical protein
MWVQVELNAQARIDRGHRAKTLMNDEFFQSVLNETRMLTMENMAYASEQEDVLRYHAIARGINEIVGVLSFMVNDGDVAKASVQE